jgi:hypothetical protein
MVLDVMCVSFEAVEGDRKMTMNWLPLCEYELVMSRL